MPSFTMSISSVLSGVRDGDNEDGLCYILVFRGKNIKYVTISNRDKCYEQDKTGCD